MKLFRILKPISIVCIALVSGSLCHATKATSLTSALVASAAAVPVVPVGTAVTANMQVRDLVMETLLRGLSGVEVKPVPERSAACLLIAPMHGEDGSLVVAPTVRLMTVEFDAQRDVLRELSVKFGGSGLKVKDQLLLLTGELKWLNQQEGGEGKLLSAKFDHGPFKGFFTGAPRVPVVVNIAQVGSELCVASF